MHTVSLISCTGFLYYIEWCGQVYAVMAPATRTRVALLITNVRFDHLGNRDGAEKDEEDMSKLLRALGYKVEPHRDLSGPVRWASHT